jgi:hypothetical protein
MAKQHPPYAAEYRRQMIELVRAGRTPEKLAKVVPGDPQLGRAEAVSGCGGGSSWDRTPRWTTLILAEDYLARTTTMYRITVGRTCSVP